VCAGRLEMVSRKYFEEQRKIKGLRAILVVVAKTYETG